MAYARALLPGALVLVFLLVSIANPDASAIEKPGSDPTRPSESIKTEEDTIQVDELGGNQTRVEKPDLEPLKLDDSSTYKVKVTFDKVVFTQLKDRSNEKESPDYFYDRNEFDLIAYVQGKKIGIVNEDKIPTPAEVYLKNKVVILDNIGTTTPLSIMTVAYEIDGCPRFPFPDDIHERIVKNFVPFPGFSTFNPLAKYPHLRAIQDELNNNINSLCDQDDDRHEILDSINKVYQPSAYGAGSHTEGTSIYTPGGQLPDFTLTYHIDIVSPYNTINK